MDREPLYSASAISAAAAALLSCLVSFGLPITDAQQSKLLVVIGIAGAFLVSYLARPKVTPVADPRDDSGAQLLAVPVDPNAL